MKKYIVLILAVFLSLISTAAAQTNENQQRQRDIKIAEGIIAEIFGSQRSQNVVLPGFQNRNVRGDYVPGYGVHFTVSSGFSNFVHIRNLSSNDEKVRVEVQQNGNSSGSDSDNEEEIREKIFEYMTKYASLISGLSDDETIRVTYAPNQSGSSLTWIFVRDGERNEVKQSGLSVWAKISDLKQYRNGNISEQQLRGRINTHTLGSDETYADFNIFASVLETALNSTDAEHLRVSRKPQIEYLPGLGVRYRVQVSARPGFMINEINFFDGNYQFKMDSLRWNVDESAKLLKESLEPFLLKMDSILKDDLTEEDREELRENLQRRQREFKVTQENIQRSLRERQRNSSISADSLDLSSDADTIMDQLLNVIEHYGSTLTSLANDEMLMISVNWSSRSDDLPERTEVRIKKSDLLRGEDPDIEEIERR